MIEALRLWMAVYTTPSLSDDDRYELKRQAGRYSRAAGIEGFPTDNIKL